MNAGLLQQLLGGNRTWSPPCVVILDAEAAVKTPGPDTIMSGGLKNYAPRYSTGRIDADSCCLLREESALLVIQQQAFKDSTGETCLKQTLTIVDLEHVVGLEYNHFRPLEAIGIPAPLLAEGHEYRPGTLVG
jgi:hypothetical protein